MATTLEITKTILENREELLKISFSSATSKSAEYKKIILRPIILKGKPHWQAEMFKETKVFHLNLTESEAHEWLLKNLPAYSQINAFFAGTTKTFIASTSGTFKTKTSTNTMQPSQSKTQTNNRQKEYILKEGENIPALVDLGVFTPDFKIVKSKYDKFKQINRFIEIIDDYYNSFSNPNITILDFGCGKSYLTFIVYYYFVKIKKINAKIIGYDLKADVVENCNKIAKKYSYDNLTFVVSDVSKDVLYNEKIDMIISLHACDTATDHALFYSIAKNVSSIFSVPCCQHEINLSIKKGGGELDLLTNYGIIKERTCALLTDSIRAMLLEDMGYSVDVLEFVDLSHSPKNLMIRARKTKSKSTKNLKAIEKLLETYKFKQTLFELLKNNNYY